MRSLRACALSVGSTAHCRRSAGFAEKVWVGHSGRPLTDECYSHSRSEAKVTQLSKLTLKVKGQRYCATLSRGPPAPRGWASAGTVLRRTKTPAVEISLIATMGAATGIEQVCLIQIRDHEDDAIEMSDRRGQGLGTRNAYVKHLFVLIFHEIDGRSGAPQIGLRQSVPIPWEGRRRTKERSC
jgi:hypothetical protein